MARNGVAVLAVLSALTVTGCHEATAVPTGPDEAAAVRVQEARAPGGGVIGYILAHGDEIGLTAEQRTRLEALSDEPRTKSRSAFREVREILTDDQRETLRELRSTGHAARRTPPTFALRMALRHGDALALTDSQREQLRAMVAELREQAAGLTREERRAMTREERRARREAVREAVRERLESILTAEQIEELRSIASRRGQGRHQRR